MTKDTSRKKCMHCGQLILRKVSKSDATSCQILRLKCTKFDFHWLRPRPRWGSLQGRVVVEKGRGERKRKGERKGSERKERGWEYGGNERGNDLPDQCQTAS